MKMKKIKLAKNSDGSKQESGFNQDDNEEEDEDEEEEEEKEEEEVADASQVKLQADEEPLRYTPRLGQYV